MGLDIGGVNVKAVRLERRQGAHDTVKTASRPFEIWRGPELLVHVLSELGRELDAPTCQGLALTMTAELSDVFRTKREGVSFICKAVREALPEPPAKALDLSNCTWADLSEAHKRPLDFAANNWPASAKLAARRHPNAVLMDVGSTTTDIIPIVNGRVAAQGQTDPQRLTRGELVYSGALRTNPDTLADTVPLRGQPCRMAAERFTIMADVHLLLGNIGPSDYTCPTPDGRGRSPKEAAERLARLICANSEELEWGEIMRIARYLHERQLYALSEALLQVLSGLDVEASPTLLAAGAGAFMVRELGARLNMPVKDFPSGVGPEAAVVLPAFAAASLLADVLEAQA
jgi:hypothetical protein